jgi:hypothetical protein
VSRHSAESATIQDRAIRLFRFLMHAQETRDEPVRTVDAYGRDGAVVWFDELPRHPAVRTALDGGEPEPGQPYLIVDRLPRFSPPAANTDLEPWIDGNRDDPGKPPKLRPTLTIPGDELDGKGDPLGLVVTLDDRPEIAESFTSWLERWSAWSDQDQRDRYVRDLYSGLFAMYVNARGHAEELELVMSVGCLSWAPPDHPRVFRHLLTAPAAIEFDEDSGRLTVGAAETVEAASVEVDMLDARLITQAKQINDAQKYAGEFAGHLLDHADAGAIVRRVVHVLASDADYRDDVRRPVPADHPVCAFAPALVLRKRARKGFVEIFRTIINQLNNGVPVPEGVLPLVDPSYEPSVNADPGEGAVVVADGDAFLPRPVNDRQLQILRRVDTHAQTLVQGPPGTGKTHTAAALISHLLAQGKRVLVTAHTDRALKEVRAKLPREIRPLAVSVVGNSREDMSELRTSVERIGNAASETDRGESEFSVQKALDTIADLGRARSEIRDEMVESRQDAVREQTIGGYTGTLARIARAIDLDAQRYGWLAEHVDAGGEEPPLTSAEMIEWYRLVTDSALTADEAEARGRVVDPALLPDPQRFADMIIAEARAAAADRQVDHVRGHPAWDVAHVVPGDERNALQDRLRSLRRDLAYLSSRAEPWVRAALADVNDNRGDLWIGRLNQIRELIARAASSVQRLDSVTEVSVRGDDVAGLVPIAAELHRYLAAGNTIKVGPDRRPRIGALTAKPVKRATPLFEAVSVDGLPPTTAGQVTAFLVWVEATKTLNALDRAWPSATVIPHEDTVQERLQWHVTEADLLGRVVGLAVELQREERRLARLGLPAPVWGDDTAIRGFMDLLDSAAAADRLAEANAPLEDVRRLLAAEARWVETAPRGTGRAGRGRHPRS